MTDASPPRAERRRLRLSLDATYPEIVGECQALLARCFTANRVSAAKADDGSTVVLSVYSSHLTCLFPQAGSGKKHERPILLEQWQRAAIEAFPWAFIRGCIRSDGCCFINRTGPYRYLSYDFCNLSADIREHFMLACDAAAWRTGRGASGFGSTGVRAWLRCRNMSG